MASAKGKLARLVSDLLLRRATVAATEPLGNFQRVLLRCDLEPFAAGAKVQLLLPTDDMRTYTPIPAPAGFTLLAWKHAGGPGSHWMATARPGDALHFAGPQRSLKLPDGPALIVGDETSVAVAAALAAQRPAPVHAVIQSNAPDDVLTAAASVGLTRVEVLPRGDHGATAATVARLRAATPDAAIALTGGAELIALTRDALRAAGIRSLTTKAYWIPGRKGLD